MKRRDEKDEGSWRRSGDDGDDDSQLELEDVRTDLLSNLRAGYSWIQHFQNEHPGWEFLGFEDIPWTPLAKKLADCRMAYVSLAGVYARGQKPFHVAPSAVSDQLRRQRFKTRGDWSYREIPRDVASADLMIAHDYYDHADADEDINCVFPVDRLRELEFENIVASVNEVHFSLMGYVPEWELFLSEAAAEIADRLAATRVDAVFLSPGGILGHQNMAVIQRFLEERGFATLSLSLCPDITEQVGVPRSVSLRFPQGNPFGAPLDSMTQYRVLRDAMSGFEQIEEPGASLELPYEWTIAE